MNYTRRTRTDLFAGGGFLRATIHTTVDKNTLSVIHRVMKERKCKKSAAVDHIVGEYERRKRKAQVDEEAERVIEKLADRGGRRV